MTHYHFLGAAAASAALIAFLNSPTAQQDMMNYLGFMEHGIYTAASNMRGMAEEMKNHNQQPIVYPQNASLPQDSYQNNNNNGSNNTKNQSGNSTGNNFSTNR